MRRGWSSCDGQAACGLTVLSWLADGRTPGDTGWLLTTTRLTGPRRQRIYGGAERLAEPVRELVIANWTWVLSSIHGGRVTASFFAGRAYPDGYATMTLTQLWSQTYARRGPHPYARRLVPGGRAPGEVRRRGADLHISARSGAAEIRDAAVDQPPAGM